MKTEYRLIVINHKEIKTLEDWRNAIMNNTRYEKRFRTLTDCFEYLGCRLPRCGHGYCGHDSSHEYIVEKVRA